MIRFISALFGLILFTTSALAAPLTVSKIEGLAAARVTDIEQYTPALKSKNPVMRQAGVRALGRLQNQAAVDAIIPSLADPVAQVRAATAFAIGQLESADPTPLTERFKVETDPTVRVRLVQALGKLKNTDSTVLFKAGDDKDPTVRATARIALGIVARAQKGALPKLAGVVTSWLSDTDDNARYGAAFALMRAKSLTSAPMLTALLSCARDTNAQIRTLCVRGLSRFESGAEAGLQGAVKDTDWRVASQAYRAAAKANRLDALANELSALPGRIRSSRAQLAGPRLHVWTAALDVVLKARRSPATTWLGMALLTEIPVGDSPGVALGRAHIRCRAAALLDRDSGERLATCDPAAPPGLKASLIGSVLADRSNTGRLDLLKHWFTKAEPAMRVALLEVAGRMGRQPRLAAIIRQGVEDADMAVFSQAAQAAGSLKMKSMSKSIRTRINSLFAKHEYEAVLAAFKALSQLEDKWSIPILRDALIYPNIAVAQAAEAALKALGESAKADPTARPITSVSPPRVNAATIQTTKGEFKIRLYSEDAPLTVKNFIKLAQDGYFDQLQFHRVVPDFVVQGGDPRGDGWGGPGYAIPCEINPQPYRTGAVGMALAGKDTGGSQWFVTHSPQPHLEGRYTVFGQVIIGQAVVDALAVGDQILKITLH